MKKCPRCKNKKPLADYGKNNTNKDSLQDYCRSCVRSINHEYYLKTPHLNQQRQKYKLENKHIARQYVNEYLRSHPCTDCHESDIILLDFDHTSNNKVSAISSMISSGVKLDNIKTEISKCAVRCANCHRRITFQRAGWVKV